MQPSEMGRRVELSGSGDGSQAEEGAHEREGGRVGLKTRSEVTTKCPSVADVAVCPP